MKMIYNEGRIVGLSQYEIYVRQLMSTNPEATPMTEREWLTSTLANNLSMILRIPAGTTRGVHDYLLPEGCDLAACTQVFGSLFEGQVALDESGFWAIRVDDYGYAISNTESLHPETPGTPEYVPSKEDPTQKDPAILENAREYLKIRETFIIQPGKWEDVVYPPDTEDIEHEKAAKYLDPDFHKNGFVRILVTSAIEKDIYILLHGFVDKVMLKGEVSFPYQGQSNRPEDGDFLGPATFPWSSPVILIISSDIANALVEYQEEINQKVKADIFDLKCKTLYLGTLHTVTWDAALATEYIDYITNQNNDVILATKTGTVAEMWQDDTPITVLYYVPWWAEDDEDLLAENGDILLAPKIGTLAEMVEEGGIF